MRRAARAPRGFAAAAQPPDRRTNLLRPPIGRTLALWQLSWNGSASGWGWGKRLNRSHVPNGVRCICWPRIQSRPKARKPPTRDAREARSLRRRSLTAGPTLAGSTGYTRSAFRGAELTDFDIIAREVSGYRPRLEVIEKRLDDVEKVNARLEDAALTTARALAEISGHWEAVYEAMRRKDESQLAPEQ